MACSNGTAAGLRRSTARNFAALAGMCAVLASCAGLASWDEFSGGAAPVSRGDSGGPSDAADSAPAADARTEDAGAEASVIQFVQVNAVATEPTMVPKIDVPYIQSQGAGDLSVVIVGWYDDATVASVTDTKLNTYRLAVGPTMIGPVSDRVVQAIYYASGIAAAAPNANIVTVRFDKSTDSPDVRILEYRGLDKAEPLDAVATSSGNSLATTSGPATTRFAPALLVAGGITGSGYSVAGANFTVRTITEGASLAADRVVDATGTYSSDVPVQAPEIWVMQLAAFH